MSAPGQVEQGAALRTVEVYADVCCPFAHVGLRRLVERRAALGRTDVVLKVRAWPLELVNGAPLDPTLIDEEVAELRKQVAPDLFAGFDAVRFPRTSLPAMALASIAYDHSLALGERVSLALRDALFEQGRDIADPDVLSDLAAAAGIESSTEAAHQQVLSDWSRGQRIGVLGSPHFFVGAEDFFCPSLHIARVDGHLTITSDRRAFDAFVESVIGPPGP